MIRCLDGHDRTLSYRTCLRRCRLMVQGNNFRKMFPLGPGCISTHKLGKYFRLPSSGQHFSTQSGNISPQSTTVQSQPLRKFLNLRTPRTRKVRSASSPDTGSPPIPHVPCKLLTIPCFFPRSHMLHLRNQSPQVINNNPLLHDLPLAIIETGIYSL